MKTSVLLADDHTVVRQGLRALIQDEKDMTVVGEAGDGREAVHLAGKLQPDVILMDVVMPEMDGLEAARRILREAPRTKIVILSCFANAEYVKLATELGAAGYLIKESASSDVIKAIREVKNGNAFFSPCISQRLMKNYREAFLSGRPTALDGDSLTARELEILHSIADGKGNQQIALDLSVSVKTVEKHRQQVMNKLDIHDVAGLTRYAICTGLVASTGAPRQEEGLHLEPSHS